MYVTSTHKALSKFWVGRKICDDPTASNLEDPN